MENTNLKPGQSDELKEKAEKPYKINRQIS
jgi:hypothetical protein